MQEMGKLPFPSLEGDDERSRARALATIHSHPVVSSVFGINFLSIAELHARILFLTFWVSQWMVRRWMAQFGEGNTVRLMECNNQRPIFALRCQISCIILLLGKVLKLRHGHPSNNDLLHWLLLIIPCINRA